MTKWKDKIKAARAAAQAKAILLKDTTSEHGRGFHAALDARSDKNLQRWYKEHLEGHQKEEVEGILQKALDASEITAQQADTVRTLISYVGDRAYER